MKALFKNKFVIGVLLLGAGLALGWLIFAPTGHVDQVEVHEHEAEVWTCSMHPSVRQSEPGQCPICGMDLIPLEDNSSDGDPMEVKMSETAVKLANIQTMTIKTGSAVKEIRLNGKIQADERKISSQTSHIPGRIEQLMVNFTGDYVQRGTIIAYVYSPELTTAQRELLEAYKIRESQPELYDAAREKLRNWKLSDKQIDNLVASQKLTERYPILANVSGIVLKRNVNVGDYVARGASLYEIADLSSVWVMFDVYESDIPWVKQGSAVNFTVQSLPGEEFKSKITFVDPILDPKTRVAKARAEMPNASRKFKPEMFVTGIVKTQLKQGGQIVLPKTAVMWTGERSIVYLKTSTRDGISFRMQEVTLGPSLGESYTIAGGLEAGMDVVVNGTFTIDAAAQLADKPSMMNKEETVKVGQESNSMLTPQLRQLLTSYLGLKDALVETNHEAAAKEANKFLVKLKSMKAEDEAKEIWTPLYDRMVAGATVAINSHDIEAQRMSFSDISDAYHEAINRFNVHQLNAYYQYCPMAFDDKGAYWISKEKEIKNPYFGSKMMRCGETRETLN